MTPPHHVDSTQHPTGAAALFEEVCRLRQLLRTGAALMGEVMDVAPAAEIHFAAVGWQMAVRKELGE